MHSSNVRPYFYFSISERDSLIGWFVGQVMKDICGKADQQIARQIMEEMLSK